MSEPAPRTALIIPIELPEALERLRLAGDPMAQLGVPAHVTLLFPFVPAAEVDDDIVGDVGRIMAAQPTFEVELTMTRRFPSSDPSVDAVLWLAPEPAEPFIRLTDALAAAYPAYPPYGGAHDVVIPHLTIATEDPAHFDELESVIEAHLPVQRAALEAALLVEDADGRWSTARSFGLG